MAVRELFPLPGESLRSWGFRRMLNIWPCYRGSGGRLAYLAGNWCEARVRLSLGLRTRNYVGTIFGGSLYGSIDPIYMLMLIKALGPEYIVWDKTALIRFKKPGTQALTASFYLSQEELALIRKTASEQYSLDRIYLVEFKGSDGTVCASIEKTLYIRRKDASSKPDSASKTGLSCLRKTP